MAKAFYPTYEELKLPELDGQLKLSEAFYPTYEELKSEIEIIGNIHDTPFLSYL